MKQWVVPALSGKPGASILYSDLAIQTMATIKAVYCQRGMMPPDRFIPLAEETGLIAPLGY